MIDAIRVSAADSGRVARRSRISLSEPTVEEMLADPIVRLVMNRDHVRSDDVHRLINRMRQHLGGARASGA